MYKITQSEPLPFGNKFSVVSRLFIYQLGITLFLTLIMSLIDIKAGYSALAAGLLNAAPTFFVGRYVLIDCARPAGQLLIVCYVAEFLKLIFIVLGTCVLFKYLAVNFVVFLFSLLSTFGAYFWVFPIYPQLQQRVKMVKEV